MHIIKCISEDQLVMICLDIFFGGAATTSNIIDFAFLVMVLYPDIQKKVHTQIDEVIEKNRDISYSDRLKYELLLLCEKTLQSFRYL